jgi:hypothetical protein
MVLRLITATERLAEANSKDTIGIFGPFGIGKTSLVYTLDEATTLFIDIEAGMKSAQTWLGDSLDIRSWLDAWDIACLVGGIDPAVDDSQPFSAAHHAAVWARYGKMIDLDKYRLIFVDSITDLTRLGMVWAQQQPEAFAENKKTKQIVKDTRGAYGLLGRECVRILKHLQHSPAKSIVFVGGLEKEVDSSGYVTWEMQLEGGKTGREFPFIVDNIITMDRFDYATETGFQHNPGKGQHRAFVCCAPNPWGLPAKDRSGQLDLIEEPHLGKLIDKLNRPARETRQLITTVPGKGAQ